MQYIKLGRAQLRTQKLVRLVELLSTDQALAETAIDSVVTPSPMRRVSDPKLDDKGPVIPAPNLEAAIVAAIAKEESATTAPSVDTSTPQADNNIVENDEKNSPEEAKEPEAASESTEPGEVIVQVEKVAIQDAHPPEGTGDAAADGHVPEQVEADMGSEA